MGEKVAEPARLPWECVPEMRPTPKVAEVGHGHGKVSTGRADSFNSFRVGRILYRLPRVARSSQPWADLLNAFGVNIRVLRKSP